MKTGFDLHGFLPFRLHHASENVSLGFRAVYRGRYRMTRPQWRVLAHLGQYGPQTATEIVQRGDLHKTEVSRAVFAIEKRHWLRRLEDGRDRRVQRLELTARGLAVYDALCKEGVAYNRKMETFLGAGDFRRLLGLLEKLGDL